MALYRIADVVVKVSPSYEETAHWYEPYLTEEVVTPDYELTVSQEDIDYFVENGLNITPAIAENMLLSSKFNRRLLKYFGAFIHSSALLFDGRVYLFSADSGVGKSTLTSRICRLYPDRASVINDDKPSIRMIDNKCIVYGTPFAGGTDKQINTSAELGAVVFIERGDENEISRIPSSMAIKLLLAQMHKPKTPAGNDRLLGILSQIIENYPFYLLKCTDSDEAVCVALEATKQV